MIRKLARPMEMVFSGPKRFELRDVPQSAGARGSQEAQRAADPAGGALQGEGGTSPAANLTMNERIRREVCGLPPRYPTTSSMTSSVVSCSSVLSPDTGDEEKLTRLESPSAVNMKIVSAVPNSDLEGDTKANEKTLPVAGDESPNEEDLWGGPGEAMALDDDLPNTNLADIDQSPDSPNSPVSPTHASNSSSSDTKDRDFLIDDEIADQPGLVFGSARRRVEDEPSLLDRSKTIAQLAGDVSQALHNSLHRDSHGGSAETLSPCESLASDDLMGDFDMSALDELNDLEDGPLCSEIMSQSDQVIKEWSSLLSSNPGNGKDLKEGNRVTFICREKQREMRTERANIS
uniref:S-layer protein n=2 Tax=Lygus hesperus TaxID=30085 RepID=A0A0A9XKX3_LYGHE